MNNQPKIVVTGWSMKQTLSYALIEYISGWVIPNSANNEK